LINIRVANAVNALANGPMTIRTSGNQQNAVIDAQTGTTTLEGNVFLATAADSISFSTVGVFEVTSLGTRPSDQILFSAGKVQMLSKTTTIQAVQLQAQISGNTTMTTTSDGTFQTIAGSLGVISVVATDTLSLLANNQMTFSTNLPQSPLTIEAQGAASSISISTAKVSSPISFLAAGLLSNEGTTISYTAAEGIVIDSNDAQDNRDSTLGTISIFASGNVNMQSQLSFSLVGQNGVYLQTTNTQNGVGAPINITSTGAVDFNSQQSIFIQNTPNGRGNVTFIASNDLNLIDDNSSLQGISLTANSQLNFGTQSSLNWITTGPLIGSVNGDISFAAAGKDKSGLFGLLVETTQGNTVFSSKQGSLSAIGANGVNLVAGSTTLKSDLTIVSAFQGSIIGHGSNKDQDGVKIQTTNGPINMVATQAAFNIQGGTGVQFIATNGQLSLTASGTDPSTSFGIRFASTAANANIDIRSLQPTKDMAFTSVEGIHLLATGASAGTLSIYTPTEINISTRAGGNINIGASDTLSLTSAGEIQITSPISNFSSTGGLQFNANTITFGGTGQALSITTTENAANTDISILATNQLNVFANTNDGSSIVLEATSPAGADLLIASGTGSVSIESGTINLQTEASIAFESSLMVEMSASSVIQFLANNQVTFKGGFTSSSKFGVNLAASLGLVVSANEIFFNGAANNQNKVGTFTVQSQSTYFSRDINIETNTLVVGGQDLILTSPTVLLAAGRVQFDTPDTYVLTSKFLIPFSTVPVPFDNCDYDRELVFNPQTKQLCVCSSYYFFTDSPQSGRWMCQTLID